MGQNSVQTTSRREQQRAETHERIFQAAVAEFRRVGFSDAQIPRIAAEAGVVRGTFYFHFPSKEHVLLELSARYQLRVVEALRRLRGAGVSLRQVLDSLIDAITDVDEALGESDLLREVLAMYLRAPQAAEPTERERGMLEELSFHFAVAMERGELRPDFAVDRLAATVLTSVFGVVLSRHRPETDKRAELELLTTLLLSGMGRDCTEPSAGSGTVLR
jgi:AcrR family transcriptional regulator